MKKEQRARFRELKRKEKNNGLETKEETRELTYLYWASTMDNANFIIVFEVISFLCLIAVIVMRIIF